MTDIDLEYIDKLNDEWARSSADRRTSEAALACYAPELAREVRRLREQTETLEALAEERRNRAKTAEAQRDAVQEEVRRLREAERKWGKVMNEMVNAEHELRVERDAALDKRKIAEEALANLLDHHDHCCEAISCSEVAAALSRIRGER